MLYHSLTYSFSECRRKFPNVHSHKSSRERSFIFNFDERSDTSKNIKKLV